MDDDEDLTEAEIDELFERTQLIGNALNALYQAELAVAAIDDSAKASLLDSLLNQGTDVTISADFETD